MNLEVYLRPGLALAIGLLIGLQRERSKEGPAGIRTFALIAVAGFLSGILSLAFSGWIVVAGILFLAAALGMSNFIRARREEDFGGGATTEIAAFLVFGIGAWLSIPDSDQSLAVIFSGVIALLLFYKKPLHQFVRGLDREDVHAIMQFALITLVILPVLPNRTFGPFDVVNPFTAWLMVVLIVGIGLAGYLLYRVAGSKVGTTLSGLLGGLVSSTATTVSASRFARGTPDRATAAALIVMIASAVSIVRVLIEMAAVNPVDFPVTGPPIAVFLLVFTALTLILYRLRSTDVVHLDPPDNPAELKPAILFGLLYVLVLVGVAAAKEYLGQTGLYAVGIISGLTDMDAITLSTAELISKDKVDVSTGWRVILVAALSNLVFKVGIVGVLGGMGVLKRILLYYGIGIAAGLAILFFWPW